MVVPKYIAVKNASGQTTAYLSPDADGLKNCYIDCRLNGESTLEFLLPPNSPKIAELTPDCKIIAGGREFVLLKEDAIDIERTEDNKIWAKVMALESWTLLDSQYIEPYLSNDPFTPVPADLAVIIVGGGSDLSGGRYTVGTAAHALYAVLNGSGWSLGTVDVPGIHDIEVEKMSRLGIIKEIQNTWGGYLVWDSVNKTVSLRDPNVWQNYSGYRVQYRKNLKNITRTQSNRLITKLYAFGKDDLDIASVNGGVKYLTNFSYTHWEYTGIYRNPDIEDAQELKDTATISLASNCRPKYLYRVKIVDLRTLPEFSHESFELGDMADVIDPDVSPDKPRPRIIRHKYNVFKPWECELELGDPEERFIEQLKASFNVTGYLGDTFTSGGRLSGYKLEDGSIAADKIKLNELVVGDNIAMGPHAYISWDNVTHQPDIGGIALNKINSTYIDGNGVWTPYVYATNISVLNGKITTAQIVDLVVGGNVIMGPNATISWSNVTNQPDIPDEYTDADALRAWERSGYATHINSSGVYSGSFNGGMFNINPTGSSSLKSGLTIGGYYADLWRGEAFRMEYDESGDGGDPAIVLETSPWGGLNDIPILFDSSAYFDQRAEFRNNTYFYGFTDFRDVVDFSGATVQGLTAKFA